MKYDKNTYEDLKKSRSIDRNALDEEWVDQPNLFFHASEGHALAVSRRDRAEHEMKIAIAQIELDVRDAMVADGEKITEALVKAKIRTDQEYNRVHVAFIEACLEADKWYALSNSYRQRADALKGLTQFNLSGHYGENTGASERRDARGRVIDNSRDR